MNSWTLSSIFFVTTLLTLFLSHGKDIYMGVHGGLSLVFFIGYKEYGYVNVCMQLLTMVALVFDYNWGYATIAGVLTVGTAVLPQKGIL
jgi:hypothetical protein